MTDSILNKITSLFKDRQNETRLMGRDIRVSFEYFPPKTAEAEEKLWETIDHLSPLSPSFMTVTYGAGGSTRDKTLAIATEMQIRTGLPIASHLTCVAASRDEIHAVARNLWDNNVRHIVALRGDMPGGGVYVPHPSGYAYTSDLVEGLKKLAKFEVSVAAYPEKHPDAPSLDIDIDNLRKKLDAGADRAITQFFFEPHTYLQFLDKVRAKNIHNPIVPGILPIGSFSQVKKFAAQCGTHIPKHIAESFDGLDNDPKTSRMVGGIIAVEQCRVLYAMGIRDFHFYTMNKSDLVYGICHMLGIRPPQTTTHSGGVFSNPARANK